MQVMEEKENKRVFIKPDRVSVTREQKAGFVLVISIGFLSIILGIFYIGKHLSDPFNIEYTGPRFISDEEKQLLDLMKQKQSDTDGDSLSDYDESNIYGTSPYLADTDSDGVSDADEIAAGTDPLCAGNDCSDSNSTPIMEEENINSLDLGLENSNQDNVLNDLQNNAEQIKSSFAEMSVAEMRQLLIDSGANKEDVDALSDEEIKQLFNSIINNLFNDSAASTGVANTENQISE